MVEHIYECPALDVLQRHNQTPVLLDTWSNKHMNAQLLMYCKNAITHLYCSIYGRTHIYTPSRVSVGIVGTVGTVGIVGIVGIVAQPSNGRGRAFLTCDRVNFSIVQLSAISTYGRGGRLIPMSGNWHRGTVKAADRFMTR